MEQSDRKDLKIQALLEKVSSLTTEKENQIADLRVELTALQQDSIELLKDRDERIVDLETRLTEALESQSEAVTTVDADAVGMVVEGDVENVSDEKV